MKKFLLSFMTIAISTLGFAQSGTMTIAPDPITTDDIAGTITISYDPTGSSLNTSTDLDLYMWVGSKNSNWGSKTLVMAKVSGNEYTYTLNVKTTLGLTDAEALSASSIGIIVRDAVGSQTGNFEFNIVPAQLGSDRFSFDFGPKPGGEGWIKVELVDSGDGNKFEASIIVPADYDDYRGWVGYNSGGIGDPGWIAGKSGDVNLSDIPGIAAGKMIVSILKDSSADNWGISMVVDTSVGLSTQKNNSTICRGTNNSIVAQFDGKANIVVYSISGVLVKQLNATDQATIDMQKGLYIVKINSEAFKVIVN